MTGPRNRTLVLGGARSGKSAHAEMLAAETGREIIYIATANATAHPGDTEMASRIAQHRQQRDSTWMTVEEPISLGAAIMRWSTPQRLLLVDCLTVWLSNLLFAEARNFPEIGPDKV